MFVQLELGYTGLDISVHVLTVDRQNLIHAT